MQVIFEKMKLDLIPQGNDQDLSVSLITTPNNQLMEMAVMTKKEMIHESTHSSA